jgi:hypothetical protein
MQAVSSTNIRILGALILWVLLALTGTQAQTVTADFDSPTFASGQVISTTGDISFESPVVVFKPTRVSTFSGTQALKNVSVCESSACNNGAYSMIFNLAHGADSVSLRVGADSVPFECFPEGTTCAMYARLIGYQRGLALPGGKQNYIQVADSKDVFLFDASTAIAPITTELKISDLTGQARIERLELRVGKGAFSENLDIGYPGQPQIDHLVVNIPTNPPPASQRPAPPTIRITAPNNGQQLTFPYGIHLKGSVAAPGGVAAFCYGLNTLPPKDPDACRNNNKLQANNTFDIVIDDADLKPGPNDISVSVFDLWGQKATQTQSISTLPPSPPVVSIYNPTAGEWLPAGDVFVSGRVLTVGALQGFCVIVDAQNPPNPVNCRQNLQSVIQSQQPLSYGVRLPGALFTSGGHQVSVFAVDRWNQMGTAAVSVNLPTDLRIVAMEVTQGIQKPDLPINVTGVARYDGVKLRMGIPTVVRVFVNSVFPGEYSGATVLLDGFKPDPRYGEQQLGSVLADSSPPKIRQGGLDVPLAMRLDPNGAYVFTLPSSWTMEGGLRLTARLQVNWPVRECSSCTGNNEFSLTDINFEVPTSITISPISLVWTNAAGRRVSPAPPSAVFAPVLNISPASSTVTVRPYVGTIDISDLVGTGGVCDRSCENFVFIRVILFEEFSDQPGYTIGISSGVPGIGLTVPVPYFREFGHLEWTPIAIADTGRPLTSVGHEFYHQLGYFHAGALCSGVDLWVFWPPDQKGFIQGVGLDRTPNSAGPVGQYRILVPGTADLPRGTEQYFDLMSYCANDTDAWISVHNWDSFGGPFPSGIGLHLAPVEAKRADQGSTQAKSDQLVDGGTVRVVAVVDENGKVVTQRVLPGMGSVLASGGESLYSIAARNEAGAVLIRIPAVASTVVVHHRKDTALIAEVPARGVARFDIERQGRMISTIERSHSSPVVSLTSPQRGSSLSQDDSIRIGWNAADADSDKLEVRVEYSSGPDRPFKTLSIGPNRGETTVPGYLLSAATSGRLRVVASDGFNESEASVDGLTVVAGRPIVEILGPANESKFVRTMPVRLEAAAFGEAALPISGDRIEWHVDGSAAGKGSQVEVHDLKPGSHVAKATVQNAGLVTTAQVVFTVVDISGAPTLHSRSWVVWILLAFLALAIALFFAYRFYSHRMRTS